MDHGMIKHVVKEFDPTIAKKKKISTSIRVFLLKKIQPISKGIKHLKIIL
jgi:hypothetical protein